MSTPHEPAAPARPNYHPNHGRKMSRRRRDAEKRKKRPPFQPDFLGLERRMMPSTFTVTSTTDPASVTSGTLRWAIEQANAATTPSTIGFSLGSSPQTITLAQGQSSRSNTADSVVIDGPGAKL